MMYFQSLESKLLTLNSTYLIVYRNSVNNIKDNIMFIQFLTDMQKVYFTYLLEFISCNIVLLN